nr:DNA methyltransferase [Burkholderia sp. WP9]
MSSVHLSQFYGIELADFAAKTAKLSLWIAEYQMNEQFKQQFGTAPPALPLRDSGNIVHGNALRRDWLAVCPPSAETEIYVVGNPPYPGRALQTASQKEDLGRVFEPLGVPDLSARPAGRTARRSAGGGAFPAPSSVRR